jgi:hypothetical protein
VDITIPAPGQTASQRVTSWLTVIIATSVSGVVKVVYNNSSAYSSRCFRELVGAAQGLIEVIPSHATVVNTLQTVPGAVWQFAIVAGI